jgi:hypothetical protein
MIQSAPAQPTRYTLTDLGPGAAYGVNTQGIVVGSRDGQAVKWGGQGQPVLWGEVGGNSRALRINNAQQIVGTRLDQSRCIPEPCFPSLAIWDTGALVDIETRFGTPAPVVYAADVNDAGAVAAGGYLFDLATNTFRAFVDVTDMGFAGNAINADGVVAGMWHGFSFEIQRPAIWTPDDEGGAITVINIGDDGRGEASDLSDNLIVTGQVIDPDQLNHPFSWSMGIAVELEPRCIDNDATPRAVNASGIVVGDSCSNAIMWLGSRAFDLNSLVAGHTDLLLLSANDVSNNGFIACTAAALGGELHAVLLAPIACPADWNGSGALDSQDFFDYLNDFFTGRGDYDLDGETTSADFFAYLDTFFAGC